ncbi:MAG: hypothetical protein IJU37_10740 [Desulfovibrio sp.]|nr:hypothetical protein [Desulfovibrio sp.]
MSEHELPLSNVLPSDQRRIVPATVTVRLQPEEKRLTLTRPKTVRQLLDALGLAEETALVARDGQLLTPDRRIWPNDDLLVRKVASSG